MDLSRLVREAQYSHIETFLLDRLGLRPAVEGELSDRALVGAKEWFRRNDMIVDEGLDGSFDLTYDAEHLAHTLHHSRTRGERRWDEVTREVARSVEAGSAIDNLSEVDGLPVTKGESTIAIERLERWGLVKVTRDWGGEIINVVRQSGLSQIFGARGPLREYFEGSGSVVDQRVNNTANISGGNVSGVQLGGRGNTMHVTQAISTLEQARILAKTAEILKELEGVEDVEDLRASVQSIEKVAVQTGPSKPLLKEKVVEALATAGAKEAVTGATVLLSQLLTLVVG